MKKILLFATAILFTYSSLLAGTTTTRTVTTKTTTTVVTIKKDANGKVTTSSVTTVNKPTTPKPAVEPALAVKELATPIDYSTWNPKAVTYCFMMFGPRWMYNPAVAYMLTVPGIGEK